MNTHWYAVTLFGHKQFKYPPIVPYYFRIHPSYKNLFPFTWNIFGQFPKVKKMKTLTLEEIEERAILVLSDTDQDEIIV